MTKKELSRMATELGIAGRSKMNKAELEAAIAGQTANIVDTDNVLIIRLSRRINRGKDKATKQARNVHRLRILLWQEGLEQPALAA